MIDPFVFQEHDPLPINIPFLKDNLFTFLFSRTIFSVAFTFNNDMMDNHSIAFMAWLAPLSLFSCNFHRKKVKYVDIKGIRSLIQKSRNGGFFFSINRSIMEVNFSSIQSIYQDPSVFHGSIDPETGLFLYAFTQMIKPKIIAEIGTHKAISTIWFASALRETGLGEIQLRLIELLEMPNT